MPVAQLVSFSAGTFWIDVDILFCLSHVYEWIVTAVWFHCNTIGSYYCHS